MSIMDSTHSLTRKLNESMKIMVIAFQAPAAYSVHIL